MVRLRSTAARGRAPANPGFRRGAVVCLLAFLLLGAGATTSLAAPAPYAPGPLPLSTPWTGQAQRGTPLPEYPRPELRRSRWRNLNGRWQYERAGSSQAPTGRTLAQTILVPFPVGSPLSGVERQDTAGWYRRTFVIPRSWRSQHVLLNFGAISWSARVYVNGRLAGTHLGDYTSFSLDITGLLHRRGTNELIVGFQNPIGRAGEPVGKQIPGPPSGILHSASSGIWQTVWLEPVRPQHIVAVDPTPDLPHHRLRVAATVSSPAGATLTAEATIGGHVVARASGPAGTPLEISIPHPRLWSPEHPFLYGLRLRLSRGAQQLDSVGSYFAMRSISLGRVGGATRLLLNGHFVFQTGALDQGYWPDGLYTPPADAAMRFDILAAKKLGYNMLREHVKVQPDRWYYWADRLGLLVWQDMPNMAFSGHVVPSGGARAEFRRELRDMVLQLRSHPSIVTWIPFNEGWEQFDVAGITTQVKRLDPSRLVDSDSGSADCCSAREVSDSDVRDAHLYTGPFAVAPDRRASVVGEYGGELPYPPAGHRWPGTLTSVGAPVLDWGLPPVISLLSAQYALLAEEIRTRGISGSVFTELSGYEQEIGILTYDREVFTIPPSLLRPLNQSLITASEHVRALPKARPPAPAGTSGLWNFDEGQGTTAADSSGSNHPLTLSGAGWTRGVSGDALAITAPKQFASTTAAVIDPSHSFTVSAWLRADQRGESAAAVAQLGPQLSSFSLGIDTETEGLETRNGQEGREASLPLGLGTWWTFQVPSDSNCVPATCAIRANIRYGDGRVNGQASGWHQVTGVYDAAGSTITIYVDGVGQDVEHVPGVPAPGGPLMVGAGAGDYGGADAFIGAIDQLRTYARALSPAEAWQLYRAEAP